MIRAALGALELLLRLVLWWAERRKSERPERDRQAIRRAVAARDAARVSAAVERMRSRLVSAGDK